MSLLLRAQNKCDLLLRMILWSASLRESWLLRKGDRPAAQGRTLGRLLRQSHQWREAPALRRMARAPPAAYTCAPEHASLDAGVWMDDLTV